MPNARFALAALVALAATGAAAQDAADPNRPGGPGALAPEPQSEAGVASGGATDFVRADGTFAVLPDAAPPARAKPLDPEDRSEVEAADAEDTATDADGLPATGPAARDAPDGRTIVRPTPPAARPADGADLSDLPPVRARLAETDAEFSQCTAALEALGTAFEPIAPVVEARDRDCGIARPILVTEIVPGVALEPDARMRCATARALAEWVRDDVMPAAETLGATITAVDHGSTYICRRRNNRPTGKLSEHSFGNAVDVMGFRFAVRDAVRIEPREPGGAVARFQRAVREASCEHFTTVIGPGTDAAHADHIHLDIKQRRGGYRLCQ